MILSWYEHLPEEDMPPRWMWPLTDLLEDHFKDVRARRGGGAGDDEAVDGPALTNDYARERGRNAR